MPLDPIDQTILAALRRDARQTHAAIGREVGLTGPAVLARIRKLEETGAIQGYKAIMADDGLRAVVRVTTRPSPNEEAFERFIQNEPKVEACFDVDGEDTFVLLVRCAEPKDLQALLVTIRTQSTVVRTVTNIILSVVKETE